MIKNRWQAFQQSREAHQQNILRSLEHRLQVAKDNGDQALIRQLQAEMKYFS